MYKRLFSTLLLLATAAYPATAIEVASHRTVPSANLNDAGPAVIAPESRTVTQDTSARLTKPVGARPQSANSRGAVVAQTYRDWQATAR